MTAAKLYKQFEPEAFEEIGADDYERQALRALWVHRWVDDPERRRLAALAGGKTTWPEYLKGWQAYKSEGAIMPRPRITPQDITLHDKVFGVLEGSRCWFNGLSRRLFRVVWLRAALDWEFQRIGDSLGVSKQRAHILYNQAINAVIAEAARGEFEV